MHLSFKKGFNEISLNNHPGKIFFLYFVGLKVFENRLQDKPTTDTVNGTVKYGSGSTVWAKMPFLFQIATICLFVGCLYPVYTHITTMEKTIQEVQAKQGKSEMKITTLENDNTELRGKLNSLAEFTQNKVKLLDTTVKRLDGMILFEKEFDKKYKLHDFTDKINKALVEIKDELDKLYTTSINEPLRKRKDASLDMRSES